MWYSFSVQPLCLSFSFDGISYQLVSIMNADEFLSQDLQKMEGRLVVSHMLSDNQTDDSVAKEMIDLNGGGSTILGENPITEVRLFVHFGAIMYKLVLSLY